MSNRSLISVVALVYNEEATLEELINRLIAVAEKLAHKYVFEFILVDDGSTDESLSVARKLISADKRVRVVELRSNYGQTAALQAGLDEAQGEIVISMDADLQHFPEEIPHMLEKLEQGGFDVVCGWRSQRQEGVLRRWPSKVANYLLRRISGLQIHDIGTTFRAYRRDILKDFVLLGENHRFVPIFAKAAGARVGEVPIQNIERPKGKSNYGLGRTLNVFLDLFFLYFFVRYLDRPIRIFGKLAIVSFAIAVIISLALLGVWVETGRAVVREHSGFFAIAMMFYLTSGILIVTVVLAAMMSRIYYSGPNSLPFKIIHIWASDSESR